MSILLTLVGFFDRKVEFAASRHKFFPERGDIMNALSMFLQPHDYRRGLGGPEWVFFPHLGLLLGWGSGLREVLGQGLFGLRNIYVLSHEDRYLLEFGRFIAHFDLHHKELCKQHLPYFVEYIGFHGIALCPHGANYDWKLAHTSQPSLSHILEADKDYRVTHSSPGNIPSLVLERRRKVLKPEFRQKMIELGLSHEHGVGKREKDLDGKRSQRTPEEQQFTVFLDTVKKEYVGQRTAELLISHEKRPAHFDVIRDQAFRRRQGEVQRHKLDGDGVPYRIFSPRELEQRTCEVVAKSEAADSVFEHHWHPLYLLHADGISAV